MSSRSAAPRAMVIVLLIFCLLGILMVLSGAGLLALLGLSSAGQAGLAETALPVVSMLWSAALLSALMLPSGIFAIRRLMGKPDPAPRADLRFKLASNAMIFWPLLVVLGSWLNRNSGGLRLALLPPVQILVVLLPLWWLVEYGQRRLPEASTLRRWGVVSVSSFLTPLLTVVFEGLALLVLLVVFVVVLIQLDPNSTQEITRLSTRIASVQNDPEALSRVLLPLLKKPALWIVVFLGASVLIPLLEELLKPLGVWLLAGRNLTPSEGLTAGLICGAAFALFESLGFITNATGDSWAALAVGRVGTGLLHTINSGLMGWALASAWQDRRYVRAALVYLGVVAIHGVWNVFGILMAIPRLVGVDQMSGGMRVLLRLGQAAPFVLLIFSVLLLSILLLLKKQLRADSSVA